jgi:hypothetical protein
MAARTCGGTKLLSSWWPGNRKKERERHRDRQRRGKRALDKI